MDRRQRPSRRHHRPVDRSHDGRHVPEQGQAPQRCEDRGYIQSWLNDVDRGDDGDTYTIENPQWRPHNIDISEKRDLMMEADTGKRRPSWLPKDSPLRPSTESRNDRTSRDQSPIASPSFSSEKENRYAKRARRKTKDDRYDTNRSKSKGKERRDAARKPRDRKTRKRDLRSGKNVVQNFTSNEVSNERVTIKPNFTTGLFSNGRVSNSAHVPDLTFNDMDFLAREDRNRRHKDSQEKHRERVSKDLQDEADFFDQRNASRTRPSEAKEPSTLIRNQSGQKAKEFKRLEGDDLQRLKLPVGPTRPQSTPLRAYQTPSLPSMPETRHSNNTFISWSTSPASDRRREPQPAVSLKGTSTCESIVRPSAIKRLIRTGVFDFANTNEGSARTSRSDHSRHGVRRTKSPDHPQYQDKGVMNSPSFKQPPGNEPVPGEIIQGTERKLDHCSTQRRPSFVKYRADPSVDAGARSGSPFLPIGKMATEVDIPTFHQLRPIRTPNLQPSVAAADQHGYWVGHRVPHVLPTLAEVSQEISDAEQLGQHWAHIEGEDPGMEVADREQYSSAQRPGLYENGQLYGTHPRYESMADYIARLETEILGPGWKTHQPEISYVNETHHDTHNQDKLQYGEQMTAGVGVQSGNQAHQGRSHRVDYDEAEMTAFWRPNRFL